ncbi:phosphate ABC transporter permease [Pantanalinema rosaneae CENA516]|uniref:phosphate ABC transporter permease n=1 Tax=Pantanalinema rosaneae TaxID=1620701 RepID=UPI003D6EF5D7
MLIPLTRKTFETLIPPVATGAQYMYFWGKLPDFLRRLLISVVGMFAVLLTRVLFLGEGFEFLLLFAGIAVGLYWLWAPILWASLRNLEYRKYNYTGFWRGEVLDVFITEELIGQEETVNPRGDLVIVENRERCLNLEVGDDTGFATRLRVPLKRNYEAIDIGDPAEMLVLSSRSDLSRIMRTSDIYIPNNKIWVSDYPYLQRDAFVDVSRRLRARSQSEADYPEEPRRTSKRTPRTGYNDRAPSRRSSQRPTPSEDYSDSYSDGNVREPYPAERRSSRRRPTNPRNVDYEAVDRRNDAADDWERDNYRNDRDPGYSRRSTPASSRSRRRSTSRRKPTIDW